MIEPSSVTLAAGERARFFSDGTSWRWVPEKGKCDPTQGHSTTYTAPKFIVNSRTVLVTAFDPAHPNAGGTAEIRLTSSLFWLSALGIYWPLLFGALLFWGWLAWPGIPPTPVLMVNPPAVTVGKDQSQQFSANLDDTPDLDVTWSATAGLVTPNGFFTPPALSACQKDQIVTVTATSNTDKTKSASAVVVVSPDAGLFLFPALSHVRAKDSITLTAAGNNINVQWPGNVPGGRFTPPAKIGQRQVINVSITDLNHPGHVASARIVLLPESGTTSGTSASDLALINLALAAGALGAWLASVRSFVGFTGARTFVPSWGLFYLFRPGFAAGLALIVHMAHRSGSIGSADTANNPAVVVFYSALIGLFSDAALQKLHDIFNSIFGVQDNRSDKMADKDTSLGGNPVVTNATALATTGIMSIDGGNFATSSTVLLNNVAKKVTFVSDKKVQVTLDPGTAVGAEIEVKVRNADGHESPPFKCVVT
jgi:hypothetical protein